MSELANTTTESNLSVLDGLAQEARLYSEAFAMNAFQLGRVLTEAKKMVPHGEWLDWVYQNTGMGKRMVQDLMRSYRRFSGKPTLFTVEKSKLFKLLALPEGTENDFLEEHDVPNMSTREIEEAVKQVREEARRQIEAAERRVKELEDMEPEIPTELTEELAARREESARQRAEIERISEAARENLKEAVNLRREKLRLERDMQEQEELLQEQQEALNRAQEELLNMQSAQARGDADRLPADELTLDIFSAAVREFVGQCARMPYMNGTFSVMDTMQRNRYNELLSTVEGWCEQSRRALDSVAEGGIIIG